MLSPNPLSLLCALLLCLPLVILFTTTNTKHTPILNPNPLILNIPMSLPKNISIPKNSTKKQQPPTRNYKYTSLKNRVILPTTILSKNKTFHDKSTPIEPTLSWSLLSHSYNISKKVRYNKKLLPPSSIQIPDDMLVKIATRVKAKPIRPNKIAFMFMTISSLPFAPLWESYFNQTITSKNLYNIYIHTDPTFSYHAPFSGVFHNRVIPSQPTKRFSPTLAAAARRLLAHALLHDPSNSIFVLLSPSCIPLHSFNFTYHALHRHQRKSYIEILANETTAYDRWAARGNHAMLPEVKFEEFRVGSQFWALTRHHARLVISDRVVWPKFNVACVRLDSCYPEENYFPTLLNMWDPRGCVHATLTHVNWTGRVDGHPRTYEAWEVGPELIRRMRKDRPRYGDGDGRTDPFLFARKFAADALQPLMRIANDVIFRD